jgi:hypothetical protein
MDHMSEPVSIFATARREALRTAGHFRKTFLPALHILILPKRLTSRGFGGHKSISLMGSKSQGDQAMAGTGLRSSWSAMSSSFDHSVSASRRYGETFDEERIQEGTEHIVGSLALS